eukprot:501875-Amphidinium_carterae.1
MFGPDLSSEGIAGAQKKRKADATGGRGSAGSTGSGARLNLLSENAESLVKAVLGNCQEVRGLKAI